MKNQALFSSKDKSKKLKCRLLQFWFGALRVKRQISTRIPEYRVLSLSALSCHKIELNAKT